MTDTITQFRGEYAFLSNFYKAPFEARWYYDQELSSNHWHDEPSEPYLWQTNEHYFQAAKTKSRIDATKILAATTPALSKRLGRQVILREDWNVVKLDAMLTGLRQKFSHNRGLAEKLVATGEATLVEGNTWGDTYWGQVYQPTTGEWYGSSWLGRLLHIVREECKASLNLLGP